MDAIGTIFTHVLKYAFELEMYVFFNHGTLDIVILNNYAFFENFDGIQFVSPFSLSMQA